MKTEFRQFWSFIGAWFPDSDLEGMESDEQVVLSFIAVGDTGLIQQVRDQCEQILQLQELPVEEIMDEANRYFENESECRSWLKRVYDTLCTENIDS
ncbi:MAG: contact-dependent growth inhibition system immunity protein [Planctomycetota bacterium]